MLESIKRKERHHKIIFPSQHFFESWELHTIDGVTCIKWNVDEITDVVTIESILYIKEWLKLLQQSHDCVLLVAYNNENLEDFYLLENLERFSYIIKTSGL
ncbi:hypothetical protein [Lysinibacillus sp. NPDC093692]|uniref:hypothetical protein n=1 Tax=Lysinibacillus sp. NPDC093692 TaxID=3390578 RepID=UPI003CFD09BD